MNVIKRLALAMAVLATAATPAAAQIRTVDPNSAIDADLAPRQSSPAARPADATGDGAPVDPGPELSAEDRVSTGAAYEQPQTAPPPASAPATGGATPQAATAAEAAPTYERDDLIAAAEGVFGKGAEGLAGMIERILGEQGKPNAYIAGREASGAFVVGLRYGSGVMTHKVEGTRPVYWTGPSLGFDVGGDANKVFVLAYNLYDSQEIYHRFPAAEGRLFFVGGFAATYLRRGDTVLIPVRLGVGWRAGVNVGYMKFTEKAKWMPF